MEIHLNRSTEVVVRAATRGDEVALGELFERYLPEIRAFVQLHLGAGLAAHESSSDLVQSACREILADLPDFEWRGERAFKQLLFLQARRKLAERGRYHRRAKRDVARELPFDDEIAQGALSLLTPSREAMGREEVARCYAAIEQLPEDQRRVLLMCRGLGMSPSEAADELGKSANTVRVTLHRALARFARIVASESRDPPGEP